MISGIIDKYIKTEGIMESMFKDIFKDGKSFFVVMITIVVFILITTTFLAPVITKSGIDDKSLIITFIGVLATFVVVGNYAQVSEIRHNMEQELDEKKADIEALRKQNEQLQKDIEAQSENHNKLDSYTTKHIEDLVLTINAQSADDRVYAKDEIIKESNKIQRNLKNVERLVFTTVITIYESIDVKKIISLLDKLSKCTQQDSFEIITAEEGVSHTLQVNARISEEGISFYKNNQLVASNTIKAIDKVNIGVSLLSSLFKLYQDIYDDKIPNQYSPGLVDTDDFNEGDDDTFKMNNSK